MAKVGGPRVFFDIVGTFNAARLITDSRAQMAVVESIVLDSMDAVIQSFAGIGETVAAITSKVTPMALALSEATIEFEKFAGVNKELADEIIETGFAFGFTAEQSLAAGAKMAQLTALIGEAAVATATELGQTFALISGMGTADAMTKMINLQQQTSFMYGDLTEAQFKHLDATAQQNTVYANTIEVLDQLNTIENRSAASMKQITFVMNQFASQADRTGESISNMAAMSAVLIESGEEMGKAGRALRMIYARLGSNIQNNNDLLKEQGIETKNAAGEMRPLSDIVSDLSKKFPELTAEQQQNIVQTVAGNDHYVRFIKLIDNSARVTELASAAVNDQSTATEELNRVIEDNSTKYKDATAELDHYQSQLGQALLPAMTDAVNIQARFNKGLASFGESKVFTGMATFILQMQTFGQIAGGVINTYMNMKSVNIAMLTHQTVLRAINGEEIIRTDLYRQQGLFSGITLNNQRDFAKIAINANIVQLMMTEELREQENIQMMIAQQRKFVIDNEQRLLTIFQQQKTTKQEQQTAEMKLIELVQMRGGHEEYILNASRAVAAQKVMLTEKEFQIISASDLARRVALNTESIELRVMEKKGALLNIEIQTQNMLADLQMQQAQTEFNNLVAGSRGVVARRQAILDRITLLDTLNSKIAVAHDLQMADLQEEIMLQKNAVTGIAEQIGMEEALLAEHNQAVIIKQTEAMATARLNALDEETIMIMQQLGIQRGEIVMLTDMEILQAKELMSAKEHLAVADKVDLENKLQLAIAERAQIHGMNQSEQAVDRMSMSMSKLSMAAGMAAMGVGVLTNVLGLDPDESMRVQLILMTMSMIPAMVQMAAMTQQMLATSTAGVGATTSTLSLTFSMEALSVAATSAWVSMKAFMAAVAPLAALSIVISAAAYGLSKLLANANKGAEGFSELNTELDTTLSLLTALSAEDAAEYTVPFDIQSQLGKTFDLTTASYDELTGATETATIKILELQELQSVFAKDDPMFKMYQDRINIIKDFENVVSQSVDLAAGDRLAHTFGTARAAEVIKMMADGAIPEADISHLMKGPNGGDFGEYQGQVEILKGVGSRENYRMEGTGRYREGRIAIHTIQQAAAALDAGLITMRDLDADAAAYFTNIGDSYIYAAKNFGFVVDDINSGSDSMSGGFSEAEIKMRSFANAREELFFGGNSQYMSGDMMKQVVNTGVENLYQNVELLMTNNFFGLTIDEAIDKVSNGVLRTLQEQGVPIKV